jgi:hypothetical protein
VIAAAALAAGFAAAPAGAQQRPGGTDAPEASAPDDGATTTTTAPPQAVVAGPGTYSAPRWLPLRRDLPGGEITVGCTLDSHGSQFGYECGGHHDRWALDFLADTGTPVHAAGAGFATDLTGKPGGSGFGKVVSIDHGFGITTVYAHLDSVAIGPEGAWVDQTTLLGTVGQTGSASAPHLHYEVFSNPGGSNSNDPVAIDPGPLAACRGDLLVTFPQVAGIDSWAGLPWGSLTVASDGSDCAEVDQDRDAADLAAGRASGTAGAGGGAAADDAGTAWSDVIAPIVDLVGSTGTRLRIPT